MVRLLSGLTLHEISNKTDPKISVTQLSLYERNLICLPDEKVKTLKKVLNIL